MLYRKGIEKEKMSEKGQTLLFVVVAVTIALAVGVSVSSRTLNSLRRVSRTDTSSRAMAVAEGGIENLLGKTYSFLDSATAPSEANCNLIGASFVDSSCVYTFSSSPGDSILSRAEVKVEKFKSNETDGSYSFDLEPDSVKEVFLSDYSGSTIRICWSNPESAIYYYSYNANGDIEKGGIYKNGFSNSSKVKNFDDIGASGCKDVNLTSSPNGIRLRTLYQSSRVSVFPVSPATLPDQGYKLTSKGVVLYGASSNTQDEVVTIIVYKSYPYASSIFDFGIYTTGILQ